MMASIDSLAPTLSPCGLSSMSLDSPPQAGSIPTGNVQRNLANVRWVSDPTGASRSRNKRPTQSGCV
jgi:hypothetical protein